MASNFTWAVLIGVAVGVSIASVMASKREKTKKAYIMPHIDPEKIERADHVGYNDMLAWYQNHDIEETDTAFIGNWHKLIANGAIKTAFAEKIPESDKCLILGILDKDKTRIRECKLIISADFEDKILDLLGEEPMVVLE